MLSELLFENSIHPPSLPKSSLLTSYKQTAVAEVSMACHSGNVIFQLDEMAVLNQLHLFLKKKWV